MFIYFCCVWVCVWLLLSSCWGHRQSDSSLQEFVLSFSVAPRMEVRKSGKVPLLKERDTSYMQSTSSFLLVATYLFLSQLISWGTERKSAANPNVPVSVKDGIAQPFSTCPRGRTPWHSTGNVDIWRLLKQEPRICCNGSVGTLRWAELWRPPDYMHFMVTEGCDPIPTEEWP